MIYDIFKNNAQDTTNYLINNNFNNKFKLIYLDPPYNTKRNRGSRKDYKDTNKNWNEDIYELLKNCENLLSNDGFLCVSINQMELFNLKNILDKVFTNDRFIGLFPIKIRHKDRQLMINATFHDVYEYVLIYRKNKITRFYTEKQNINLEKYIYSVKILNNNPKIEIINGKKVEIFLHGEYEIIENKSNLDNLRKYIIAGKLATGNWSGEFFEKNLRKYGENILFKVYDLEKEGLGYRWFQSQTLKRKSGIYFQSSLTAGRPILPTNDLDYTEIMPNIYKEGGDGCDFKDSKKPEDLIKYLIKITTKENDLIGDFFSGSGTTITQAIKNKRQCIVCDNNNQSIDITINRLNNLKNAKEQDKIKYVFNYKLKNI